MLFYRSLHSCKLVISLCNITAYEIQLYERPLFKLVNNFIAIVQQYKIISFMILEYTYNKNVSLLAIPFWLYINTLKNQSTIFNFLRAITFYLVDFSLDNYPKNDATSHQKYNHEFCMKLFFVYYR